MTEEFRKVPEHDLRILTQRALDDYLDSDDRMRENRRETESLLEGYRSKLSNTNGEYEEREGKILENLAAHNGARVQFVGAASRFLNIGPVYVALFPRTPLARIVKSVLKTAPGKYERTVMSITRDLTDHQIDFHNQSLEED
jgi:hypothetical protein